MASRRTSHDVALLDRLSDLPEAPFSGTFWRVVHGSRSPLDGSKGAGRWNSRESEVLYAATEKDGALSEIFFHINRQQSVFPSRITSIAHEMRATFEKTLDLTNMAFLQELGVDPESYQSILYDKAQKIGEAVGFLGFEAVLVPNARHQSNNLIVFPANCDLDVIEAVRYVEVDWQLWRQSR